ncbi:MAG TPA: hypothetical protein EYQ53_03965 [Candidatus Poseidoniales archaeon]|nr:hypothetical protein [Candidatus Poseidoniales archaeon]
MVASNDPSLDGGEEADDLLSDLIDSSDESTETTDGSTDSSSSGETNPLTPAVGEKEFNEDIDSFGIFTLLRTILARNTMPHILLLATSAFFLNILANSSADGSAEFAAMGFISLAGAYAIVALLSKKESMQRMLHTSPFSLTEGEEKSFSNVMIHKTKQIVKVWALPLVITGALLMLLMVSFSDDSPLGSVRSYLPFGLGSLFVAWSIGQGVSFRASIATMIKEKVSEKSTEISPPHFWPIAITMMVANLIVGVLLIILFSAIQDKELTTSLDQASTSIGGHVLFIVLILASQGGLLWWSKAFVESASTNKQSNSFSLRWGIAVQAFATWHLMSVYRQYMMASPSTFTAIEEGLLMIITVLLAIWGMTTKGIAKENSIFTKDNALFWGLAFGFGYAGSIAMVANVLGDVKGVLIAGHLITWMTLQLLHRAALKDFLISKGQIDKAGNDKTEPSDTPSENSGSEAIAAAGKEAGDGEEDEAPVGENIDLDGDAIGDDSNVDWSGEIPDPIVADEDWGGDEQNENPPVNTDEEDSSDQDESNGSFDDDLELLD